MYNKYHSIKGTYKGIKFDSLTEMDYFKHLEELGYVHGKTFFTQVKYILIEKFKLNGKAIRETYYLADFVIKEKDGTERVIDVKGFRLGAIFLLKAKLMGSRYGIRVEAIGKTPPYFLEECNGEEWIPMKLKNSVLLCPKYYLEENGNKPWMKATDRRKISKCPKKFLKVNGNKPWIFKEKLVKLKELDKKKKK